MTTLYSHSHRPHPPPLDQPTPQSPPFYMSANHAASSTTTTAKFHSSVATGVSPPHISPLTSSFPSNSRQLPITTTNTIPTPASSVAGTVPATTSHEDTDGDLMMDDDNNSVPSPNKRRRMSNSSYDRNPPTAAPALRHSSTASGYMPDVSPPIPTEQELLSQPDVTTYYLVCPKPHMPSHPDLTDNLLALYDLKQIADSVARFNLVTGAKNKLRKSYKGFINDLPGKNIVVTKASQTEHAGDEPGGGSKMDLLGTLVSWPEEEWVNHNVHGKELSKGLDMSKLRKGLIMSKGDIPGFDASILGLDDELRRKTPHAATTPAPAVGTPHVNGSTPGGASTVSGGAGGDDARPRRKKRRRYDEGSYEGYDQFDGEEDAPVNNGSGGIGSGGGAMVGGSGWNEEKKKKKRKKNPDMSSPSAGSVGVGSMNMSHHAHHSGGIPVHGGLYGR